MYNILGQLKSKEEPLRSFTDKELNLVIDVLINGAILPKKHIIANGEGQIRFLKHKNIHIKEMTKNHNYLHDYIYNQILNFDSTIPYNIVRPIIFKKISKVWKSTFH